MRRCSATLALLVFAQCAAVGDWPQFRGAGTGGASNETGLPLTWSDSENICWKLPLPGHGASCPAVMGDRVYLTCWSGYGIDEDNPGNKADLRQHVLAIDRASGELLWDRARPASPKEQEMTRRVIDHGYATPTPCTDGEAVYAYFGVSGLVAYDRDGKLLWTADCGSKTAGFGCAASPILHGDLVIQNASIESGTLYAFHKKTGELAWKVEEINKAWTTPSIVELPDGGAELIVSELDWINAFDPQTGEKLWTCKGVDDYVVPSVVGHDGIAYCLGGRKNRAIAVRCGGRGDVTATHKLWEVDIGANVTSPIHHDGKLYWASDRGIACCLDAATGETLMQNRLPANGRIYASMVYGDGKLYVTTRDAGMIVLAAKPEYTELSTNVIASDENLFNAAPAISKGKLYLRTNGWLYCIGEG
jgi:outer membrane protein assembly factor BamB